MNKELDPHHLVAFMACTSATKPIGPFRPPTRKPAPTIAILDALANISISEEKSQVVAIAVQLNAPKREIHLTLSGNKPVKENLVNHLTQIWEKLRALSYANSRQKAGGLVIGKDVVSRLELEVFRDIYLFSLRRQVKRIEKWWAEFGKFVKKLLLKRGGKGNIKGFELSLYNVVVALAPVKPRNWASGFRVDPGLDRVGSGRVRGAGVWVGSGRPSCKPG